MKLFVIKLGGNELNSSDFLAGFSQVVATLPAWPVIVHGGGRGTSELAERLGLETHFVDGLRVTDDEGISVAVMGLIGTASTQLVQALVNAGVPALGLSGVDAGIVTAEKLHHPAADLGWVGTPSAIHAERVRALLAAGFVPCLAPISLDAAGDLYNVNADHVAQAVAASIEAEALVFLTNVPGVLRDGKRIEQMTPAEAETLIDAGTISGGMIPKVRSAATALDAGVQRVLITNLDGLSDWVRGESAGTEIVAGKRKSF